MPSWRGHKAAMSRALATHYGKFTCKGSLYRHVVVNHAKHNSVSQRER
jgi:hypothetical protein